MYLRRLHLLREELSKVILLLKQLHDLLKRRENQHLVLEELAYCIDGGARVVASRDEDASSLGALHETNKML